MSKFSEVDHSLANGSSSKSTEVQNMIGESKETLDLNSPCPIPESVTKLNGESSTKASEVGK